MTITMAKTYNELLLETQPQAIATDAENDVCLAHIERLMSMENLTPDEEKILDLLLLLSEHFEDKAYPMTTSWFEVALYRLKAFIFRWN